MSGPRFEGLCLLCLVVELSRCRIAECRSRRGAEFRILLCFPDQLPRCPVPILLCFPTIRSPILLYCLIDLI